MALARNIESTWRDLRYAFRTTRKNLGFTAIVVLSVALGTGVNTAMFTVIRAVLMRPLPYHNPEQLVQIVKGTSRSELSLPEFRIVRELGEAFSSVTAYRHTGEHQLAIGSDGRWVRSMAVTDGFFNTLGVRPSLGREFLESEVKAGSPAVIAISNTVWQQTLKADPAVVGKGVLLNGVVHTVVGVLPADFGFDQAPDVFTPLIPTASHTDRGANTSVMARLRTDVALEQAQASLLAVERRLKAENVEALARPERLVAMSYHESLVGDIRGGLLLLFGATGLLLLIACVNVMTVFVARVVSREQEFAVRMALGGTWRSAFVQSVMEQLIPVGVGGGVGLLAGHVVLKAIAATMPYRLPTVSTIRVDGTVMAFAVCIVVGMSIVLALTQLRSMSRLRIQTALHAGQHTRARTTTRARAALVIGEVSIATVLLLVTSLFIHSLYKLNQQPLGFEPRGLITFKTPVSQARQETMDRVNFTKVMLDKLHALPGVSDVAAINILPLDGRSNLPTQRDGHPDQTIGGVEIRAISPEYFKIMSIAVVEGRPFSERDGPSTVPVAVINRTLAASWWSDGRATGGGILIGRFKGRTLMNDPRRQVVGVVGDTKTTSLQQPPRPTVYVPLTQALPTPEISWILKSNSYTGLDRAIRETVALVDRGQRVRPLIEMEEIVAATTSRSAFTLLLLGVFTGVALLLTATGVYGVISYMVTTRQQEIGTRIALGASPATVLASFVRGGLLLSAIGVLIGLVCSRLLGGSLKGMLFDITPQDPWSMFAVTAVVLLIGALASYLPARRAAQMDPMVAMRT